MLLFLCTLFAAEPDLCNIEKRDGRKLSLDQFNEAFAFPGKPVILTNLWIPDKSSDFGISFNRLVDAYQLPDESAEFNRSYPTSLMVSFDHLIKPAVRAFFEQEFIVPKFFRENALLNPSCIQDESFLSGYQYRWLLFGGKGGGSGWHFDPFNTSAWNVIHSGGSKRWALYPSSTLPPGLPTPAELDRRMRWAPVDEQYLAYVEGDGGYSQKGVDHWFTNVLPALAAAGGTEEPPLQCTLGVGEIIFVPSGWWHAVQNLGDSVAYTQNFVVSHDPSQVRATATTMAHRLAKMRKVEEKKEESGYLPEPGAAEEAASIARCHAALVEDLEDVRDTRGRAKRQLGGQELHLDGGGEEDAGEGVARGTVVAEVGGEGVARGGEGGVVIGEGVQNGEPVELGAGLPMQEQQAQQKERRRREQKERRQQEQGRWKHQRQHEEEQQQQHNQKKQKGGSIDSPDKKKPKRREKKKRKTRGAGRSREL
jgi:hypothetical protein